MRTNRGSAEVTVHNLRTRVCLRAAIVCIVVVSSAACDESVSTGSSRESSGLEIEFTPICQDGEIWLSVAIHNSTAEPIRIENGALPWQYDPVGTTFEAISSGKPLTRSPGMGLVGRAGPVVLAPQERRSGGLPIEALYPEMNSVLAKQTVTVHWKYWTSAEFKNSSKRMQGTVDISKNPCAFQYEGSD